MKHRNRLGFPVTFAALLAAYPSASAQDPLQDALQRFALNSNGFPGNSSTGEIALPEDGRWGAIVTRSTNFLGDDYAARDDGAPALLILVSREEGYGAFPFGLFTPTDGDVFTPSFSGPGHVLAFASDSRQWVSGDANGVADVFVGISPQDPYGSPYWPTMSFFGRVSVASDGSEADGPSFTPVVTQAGDAVFFCSDATNLVGDDGNGVTDLFRHDLASGMTTRVSLAWDGSEADGASRAPRLTADGRILLFVSDASNLVDGDTNGCADLFARDLMTGAVERVSVGSGGVQGDGPSATNGGITPDGRFVLFGSEATNFLAGDGNAAEDVFVRDRLLDVTELVSVASDGAPADGWSTPGAISDDGDRLAFTSRATNLDPADVDPIANVFWRDRAAGITQVVVRTRGGAAPDGDCRFACARDDLQEIAFIAHAGNLVSADTNGVGGRPGEEPYLRDLRRPLGAASWRYYGDYLSGTGYAHLYPLTDPICGTTVTFCAGNSAPTPTFGLILAGVEATPIYCYRTSPAPLSNSLDLPFVPMALAVGGNFFDVEMPDDPGCRGISVFAELAVLDPRAPTGIALSRPIEIVFGD